ncbi:MAG: aconitate hydratase AcnA [Acidobacteria bacterium]|nr:aconitate hydratase AcnA [Acidobacteriota bacterium]
MSNDVNSFRSRRTLAIGKDKFEIFSLEVLEKSFGKSVSRLPFSLKILLENLLRNEDGRTVRKEDIDALALYDPSRRVQKEIAFKPSRVLMQDFTGVPAVADLAAMRDAMARMGGDPAKINPIQRADLVIDHSVQVDRFGTATAFAENAAFEFDRNRERYLFLRWGQKAFNNFSVVPPHTGIVHQVNLEFLASVVYVNHVGGTWSAYPDSLVGTDSHTTMINGLGVLGWGVGGIEAEAAVLGQPISMLIPEVVGFRLSGEMVEGATATDVVLTVTEMLRKKGVVGKFVEFYGPGLSGLSLADRATIANMAPEYGATVGFFPVDGETLNYLRLTGRNPESIALVEGYCKAQGLFRTADAPDPEFSEMISLDLSAVEPSLAGPRRPQDRVPLRKAKDQFHRELVSFMGAKEAGPLLSVKIPVSNNGERFNIGHGSVVIAAITSCTNTSNPTVMLGAGLLAKKAVERGLKTKPWVKTSLAPGSKAVTDYLTDSGLLPYLEQLRFHLVGYGCTTCIGNSGPLPEGVGNAVKESNLVAVSVLSGNRNFEGRINPLVRANYLASPPLVVAYALAGSMSVDLYNEPIAEDNEGKPVFLRDLWPSSREIRQTVDNCVRSSMFKKVYAEAFEGDEKWKALPVPEGNLFEWDEASTYIRKPPFFEGLSAERAPLSDIVDASVLAMLGDSVTTDHISPAGSIPPDSPAGQYLISHGIQPRDFNSYGARRGNHEVMMRGTFASIRLKNLLVPGVEGGWTLHFPDKKKMTIYDAAVSYRREGVPLVVIAGEEYGTGSSRDWAAKGTLLLGVRAIIAKSFERIHRSNLVGMGVLPLQFKPGKDAATLGLTGSETFTIEGITSDLQPGKDLTVKVRRNGTMVKAFRTVARIDTPQELDYYRHGGILPYVLRQLLQ